MLIYSLIKLFLVKEVDVCGQVNYQNISRYKKLYFKLSRHELVACCAPIAQLVSALDLVTSSVQVEGSILTAGKRLSLKNLNLIIRAIN